MIQTKFLNYSIKLKKKARKLFTRKKMKLEMRFALWNLKKDLIYESSPRSTRPDV